ncbi:MAG: hypothetical protein HYR96_15560 [Deltaproteobacteria bacterium]|nr:hypothetical protein [Deltaproteobacteria bacterium]MBI3294603.1 hypothetical protein [Deltaproteobacteria bacterium]
MVSIPPKRTKRRKSGNGELFDQLVHFTGLSADKVRKELHDILEKKQINTHEITIDQLRAVAASYLRQIMSSLMDRQGTKNQSH